MGPYDGEGGQCFGAVMELVKVPQGWHPVKRKMQGKTCEIVKKKEKQGETEGRNPVAGILEQSQRQQALPVQQFKDQCGDGKLCHQYRPQPEEDHPVDHKTEKVMAARPAEPDAAIKKSAECRADGVPLDQAKPSRGDDRGRQQIAKEQPFLGIEEL